MLRACFLLKKLEFGGKKNKNLERRLSKALQKLGEKNGGNGPGNATVMPRLCFLGNWPKKAFG